MNPIGPEQEAAGVKAQSPTREAVRRFVRNPTADLGAALLAAIVALSLIGPSLYDVDPFDIVRAPLSPPGTRGVPFGTDYLGRGVVAGVVYGGRATLAVGDAAAVMSVLIGVCIGSLAGFYRDRLDDVLMRITEFFQVLPTLLLAMVLVMLFSPPR